MIIHQKGLRVFGTRAIGLIILFYSCILLLGALLLLIYAAASKTFTEATLAGVILNFIQSLAFAWPALFLLGMFPDLELNGDHIRIKVLFLNIKWQSRILNELRNIHRSMETQSFLRAKATCSIFCMAFFTSVYGIKQ